MNVNVIRVIAGVLAMVVMAVIIYRRKMKATS